MWYSAVRGAANNEGYRVNFELCLQLERLNLMIQRSTKSLTIAAVGDAETQQVYMLN